MKHNKQPKKINKGIIVSIILFAVGLIIALTSATLLFFGVISSSISAIIGIIGICLIASSGIGIFIGKGFVEK